MPKDVGGTPSHDGRDPDENHDHGGAGEESATVVFDEDFVRAAPVHEPSAVERLLAAARARAAAAEAEEIRRGRLWRAPSTEGRHLPDEAYGPEDFGDLEDGYGSYGGYARWHRPVAWMLAVVMGVGVVALAFTAVYRGASASGNPEPGRPASSSEVDKGAPAGSADRIRGGQEELSGAARTP
ncbi:hypothetical protein ABZ929_00060 [Streptomyces physcomitrii]|uniref:SCO2584 family spore wall biosynthesis protein n=1 Tax=Streptomyces physcomitrii TaxID=2724184 RepID=UPI0033C10441